MRDVNSGWFLRYTHANVASFFFLFLYLHTARGLYYSSYKTPRILLWSIGVIILILTMAIAFLGYIHSPKWFNIANFLLELNIFYFYFANYYSFWSFSSCFLFTNKNLLGHLVQSSYLAHNEKKITSRFSYINAANGFLISDRLKTIIKELDLNPEYVFENLNLEETKQEILNKTKGLSGIYMILNKISQDYYIGSASTNRFYARFSNHLIYSKGSKIVKLAVKKYKLENFAFIILELYPNIVTKENNKELLDLEDKYLKYLLPNYNILTEAGSSFGYKHTEVDRKKMKDIYTDASSSARERIGNLNKGKTLSNITKSKIRLSALNREAMSSETIKKCISHTRPIILYNLNGTVYGKYSTIIEAGKAINCNEKTIRRSLKTEKKLVKRQWIVKDQIDK